ncbi:Solute carrier family 22 member 22 [Holothuria leucospilota]|uniref:Solute carrier family 22 member 22 n=1 Tax=Holothuria leucospilota TaxID=206669 RepID=A0A9Q0YG07_HOLLE|nr:Solute carrier family 22 member 22 [Holothuria leucospilota]
MDFEELLTEVGNFGRFQKIRITLLSLITLPSVFHIYIQTFTAGKSDHWCESWKTDDCIVFNLTTIECESLKRELSIPVTTGSSSDGTVYMQCQKYNVSGLNLETAVISGQNNLTSLEKIPCDEGWIFDKTTFPSSVVYDVSSQFNHTSPKSD